MAFFRAGQNMAFCPAGQNVDLIYSVYSREPIFVSRMILFIFGCRCCAQNMAFFGRAGHHTLPLCSQATYGPAVLRRSVRLFGPG
jgi:hypothetical protein